MIFGATAVNTRVHLALTLCTRGCGCARTRHSPRPLWAEGTCTTRAHRAAGMRTPIFSWLFENRICSISLGTNAPHPQPSSPGLTGRPSIPETPVMESKSRGVLDTPLARGMTVLCGAAQAHFARPDEAMTRGGLGSTLRHCPCLSMSSSFRPQSCHSCRAASSTTSPPRLVCQNRSGPSPE